MWFHGYKVQGEENGSGDQDMLKEEIYSTLTIEIHFRGGKETRITGGRGEEGGPQLDCLLQTGRDSNLCRSGDTF